MTLEFRHPSQLVSAKFSTRSLQLLVSSCATNYNTIKTDKGIMVRGLRCSNAWFVFSYCENERLYTESSIKPIVIAPNRMWIWSIGGLIISTPNTRVLTIFHRGATLHTTDPIRNALELKQNSVVRKRETKAWTTTNPKRLVGCVCCLHLVESFL
jgi:hypothetical protein